MANRKIKLVKSLNGRLEKHIATAESLGLRKSGQVTIQPDNTQSGELHNAAALDSLGNTVQVNNFFDKLRRIVLSLSISIISHCISSSD